MEKLFAINYKLRYAETSDWGTEYIKAKTKSQALNNFAKLRKIRKSKFQNIQDWKWEEGVWLAEFRNIAEVKAMTCSHCSGTGVIHI